MNHWWLQAGSPDVDVFYDIKSPCQTCGALLVFDYSSCTCEVCDETREIPGLQELEGRLELLDVELGEFEETPEKGDANVLYQIKVTLESGVVYHGGMNFIVNLETNDMRWNAHDQVTADFLISGVPKSLEELKMYNCWRWFYN